MRLTTTQVLLGFSTVLAVVRATSIIPDSYNVVWTTPSRNSSESMPVGGGDIGLNVWSENSELVQPSLTGYQAYFSPIRYDSVLYRQERHF
jgi:hypothetical protein